MYLAIVVLFPRIDVRWFRRILRGTRLASCTRRSWSKYYMGLCRKLRRGEAVEVRRAQHCSLSHESQTFRFALNFRCNLCMLPWITVIAGRNPQGGLSLQTALSNLEEMQHKAMYHGDNRSRSMGVGPMRSRPMEKRHDTSPYSGVPYLSPPPPDTWRRTNSDSALHQSANEACQSTSAIPHRRGKRCASAFFPSFFPLLPLFIISIKTRFD